MNESNSNRKQISSRLLVSLAVAAIVTVVVVIWLKTSNDEPATATRDGGDSESVQIDSPQAEETVTSPVTVSGKAEAFEANVIWELKRNGDVVDSGYTTAEECCTLSPYSFQLTLEPGTYELTVSNTDPSDGEGKPPTKATRTFTVQ